MPLTPEQILERARGYLKEGKSVEWVQSRLKEYGHPSLEELGTMVTPVTPGPAPTGTPSPLGGPPAAGNPYIGPGIQLTPRQAANQAVLLGQGAALGAGDELAGLGAAVVPGGKGYRQGRDVARQRLLEAKAEQPGAGFLQGLGGVISPANLVLGLMRVPATVAGKVASGAGIGAGYGGFMGAANAPELADVPREAGTGAAIGGLLGGGISSAMAVPQVWSGLFGRQAAGRGARISAEAERLAGSRGTMPEVRAQQEAVRKEISRRYFKPLDDLGPIEDNEAILGLLDDEAVKELMPKAVREGERGPIFDEIRRARDLLAESVNRKFEGKLPPKEFVRNTEALATVEEALNTLPEYVAGRPLYAEAKKVQDALDLGREMWRAKSSWEIREAMNRLTSEAQQEAFRRGMMSRLSEGLQTKAGGHTSPMVNLFHRGPETSAKLRGLFPTDEAYNQFMVVLDREAKSGDVARFLKTAAPWALVGGIGGGAFGVSLLRGLLP